MRFASVVAAVIAITLAGPQVLAQGLGSSDEPVVPQDAPGVARGTGAVLRGLDKISGRTTDITLGVGEAVAFGRLEVRLGECRYPAADPSSDAFAQMTITDTAKGSTVFAGWMIASSPALSALDDARYDVWVISCQSA